MCPNSRVLLIVVSRNPRTRDPGPRCVYQPSTRGRVALRPIFDFGRLLLIPEPPTTDGDLFAGGEAAVHNCAACGEPLEEALRDMWVFASPTSVAYVSCLFAVLADE